MAYKKQNFVDGMPLSAAQLNHMEDGIVELEKKIPDAEPESENGGYYIPSVSQPSGATMAIDFTPSKSGMPEIQSVQVTLPSGPEGKKPEKGVDYWTDSDKETIIQEVITALGTPVFGTVDENNNIILTGALADGTYTLKYEDADGNVTTIGTLTHTSNTSGYNNLADPDSADWMTSYRIKSDMSIVSDDNSSGANTVVTNYIPVSAGDIIRVKGLNIRVSTTSVNSTVNTRSNFYDASKTAIGSIVPNDVSACVESGDMWTYTVPDGVSGVDASSIAYMRFNGTLYSGYTADDVIITVNQVIA